MKIQTRGSKPCPICGRTISVNKELCFACFSAHGTLANYEELMTRLSEFKKEDEPVPVKVRKPRAKKEAASTTAAPKTRKPRTTKVVAVV